MKRLAAIILSALLLFSFTACDLLNNTADETTIDESNQNNETKIKETGIIACNGVYYNSDITYAIDQNDDLILYVASWNKSFVVSNEDMHFTQGTLSASSVVLGENKGALIFGDFSSPSNTLKVIRFSKENTQVSIENLTFTTNENYVLKYCNFIDEQKGYLFLFNDNNQLSKLLKTADGGKTWTEQPTEMQNSLHWKETIICAKMVNESVGLISAKFHADNESVSRRIFITTNGGSTWNNVRIPYMGVEIGSSDIYDIKYENGKYILCFRLLETEPEHHYVYFEYSSIDLENWALVYDVEIPNSLDNELSQDNETPSPSNPNIDPDDPKNISIAEISQKLNCKFMNECGNNLQRYQKSNREKIYAYQEKENSNVFHITAKHGDTEYKSTVTLSKKYRIAETYSGFTSELEGYVIIIDLDGYAISPLDDIELKCVLKTHDGGKTWEAYEYDIPRRIDSREYVTDACFITDKIGFCTARYSSSDDFSGRTFWTLDGGKSWFSMATASSIEFPNLSSAMGQRFEYATEIKNLEIKDGTCILTVRICYGYSYKFDGKESLYIQYSSNDLVNWTLVAENQN